MEGAANSSRPRTFPAAVLKQYSHSQAERSFDQQRTDPKAANPETPKQNSEAVANTTAPKEGPTLTQVPNINPVSPRSKNKEIFIDDKYISKLDYHSFAFTYAVRDGGDAKSKKQSMADLKLRRLQELNTRLKEDLERPRVKVAEASQSLVTYCTQTRDYMVPSVWGQVDKKDDPYNPQASGGSEGCCVVM